MNDFKENFGKTMERLRTERDIVASAKIRVAAEAVERPERKISAKRILGTAAAVCGVLVCGVTAVGAAGLIDFDEVFGNRVSVSDSELASSLVGTVNNFKYKVSDKDYKIDIKGVTGDGSSVLVAAEILRKDGTPVIECFANPVPPDERQLVTLSQNADVLTEVPYCYSMDYRVNKSGNIDIFISFGGSDGGMEGSKMLLKGENFYPAGAYIDFKYNNPNEEDAYTEYTYTQCGESSENISNNVPTNLNDILALDLKWEFSFTYRQSDKSQQVKSLNAPEESFPINLNVHKVGTKDEFICKLTAHPSYIEAGSTGGRIDFEYEDTGYDGNLDYSANIHDNNDVYIVMNNGSLIRSSFDGGSVFPDGDICRCSFNLTYWDERDYKIFIEADDITAISINGTVYELN